MILDREDAQMKKEWMKRTLVTLIVLWMLLWTVPAGLATTADNAGLRISLQWTAADDSVAFADAFQVEGME